MPTATENATLEGRRDIKIKVVNEKVVLIADSMARHVNIKGVLTFYTPGDKISDVTRNIHLYRLEDATHLLIWIGSNNLDSEQGVAGVKREYLKMIKKIGALYPQLSLVLMEATPRLFTPVERVTKWPAFNDFINELAVSGLAKGACSLGLAKAFLRDGIPKGSHFTLLYPSGKRDGVHPSLRGLEAIGTVINQHLTGKIGFKWNLKYKKNDPILLHKFHAQGQ